jgi:hypothetical protein
MHRDDRIFHAMRGEPPLVGEHLAASVALLAGEALEQAGPQLGPAAGFSGTSGGRIDHIPLNRFPKERFPKKYEKFRNLWSAGRLE